MPSRLTDPCDPDPDDELAKLSPRRMQPTAGNLASLRGQQVRKSIRAPAAGSGDDSDLEVVAGVFQRHALTLVFLPLRQAEEATSSRRKPPVCLVGGRSGRPPRGSVLSVKRGGPFMGTHLLDGFGARSHARDVLFSLEYEVREEGGWPSSRTSYGMLKNIANHFTILNNLANFHLFVNTFWGG